MITAAIKAGTPEIQWKTYEEDESLLEAAADIVGSTKSALPRAFSKGSGFGTVSKRVQSDLTHNPAYDEEEFKAPQRSSRLARRRRRNSTTFVVLEGTAALPVDAHKQCAEFAIHQARRRDCRLCCHAGISLKAICCTLTSG